MKGYEGDVLDPEPFQREDVMQIIDQGERLPELRRLGLSKPVLRIAEGKRRPALFSDYHDPWKVYTGMVWDEDGPIFVPMWELYDTTTVVRRKGKGIEFFEFSVEAPREPWSLASTEQGLLATMFFDPLNMWYDEQQEEGRRSHRALATAARSVAFRYFSQADAVFQENYHKKSFDALERAYKKLVRQIDRELVEHAE